MSNKIVALKLAEGNNIRTQEGIEKELVSHFHNLLTGDIQDITQAIDKAISHIPSIHTLEPNVTLMK